MDFIMQNYVWFIIGGIILLMTIIGYIADKSNFIETQKKHNKDNKEKATKEKKDKRSKKDLAFIKEIGDGKHLVMEESEITYPVKLTPDMVMNIEIPVIEETTEPDFSFPDLDTQVQDSVGQFISPMSNNLTQDMDLNTPLENGILNLDAFDQSYADTEIPETHKKQKKQHQNSIPEIEEPENIKPIHLEQDIQLPEIDSLNKDNADDDVWKF